ncbi:MAG: bifunctional riboflavin kinase/FAD synthetase [Candidatus Nitronauta litoralis]|uniref:Riboflavin biosynthesis protein n=1 Tax=Candidatus Nitronauta litoralis TaxID=2705533 RepID=A0A7T0BUS9_9BACT|nr:MAG: bifunctional riboflavin kinase/FAD synthetase [Candidatus Nitronauta litoralis]
MKIVRDLSSLPKNIKYPVVALGNFDGVHIGHQMIFRRVAEIAQQKKGTGLAFTFQPHPITVLNPGSAPLLLTTFRKKMELIEQSGIDLVWCARFNRNLAKLEPREFVKKFLVDSLNAKEVVVGFDYAFGRGRQGTIPFLKKLGQEFQFQVHVIEQVKIDGQGVSSSYVRELLEEGSVEKAAIFLGRPYSLLSPVVHGHKTGRSIGFPTANLDTSRVQIPATGVYAVRVQFKEKSFNGVANIGFNPTFNRDRLSVEVHIFDFEEQIYGRHIKLSFIGRIRGEKNFDSAEVLVEQIKHDIETARSILSGWAT